MGIRDIPDCPDSPKCSIFDDMELGTWPTRSAVTQRDPLEEAFDRLNAGCNHQTDLLEGTGGRKGKTRGRQWWVEEPEGSSPVGSRLAGRRSY